MFLSLGAEGTAIIKWLGRAGSSWLADLECHMGHVMLA